MAEDYVWYAEKTDRDDRIIQDGHESQFLSLINVQFFKKLQVITLIISVSNCINREQEIHPSASEETGSVRSIHS
jgi:hypothetical protein